MNVSELEMGRDLSYMTRDKSLVDHPNTSLRYQASAILRPVAEAGTDDDDDDASALAPD